MLLCCPATCATCLGSNIGAPQQHCVLTPVSLANPPTPHPPCCSACCRTACSPMCAAVHPFHVFQEMGHQLGNMAMLYVLIGLLNKRARKAGDNAARQVGGWGYGGYGRGGGVGCGG
jgi:hypothetical protein